MKKLLGFIAALTITLSGLMITAPVYAGECSGGNNDPDCNKVCQDAGISQTIKDAAGCSDTTSDILPVYLKNIVNVAITVVGIVAVIAIVIGGQRLVTSSGDPQKTTQAKNMIMYAVIAVVIAGLAYAIINFVATSIGK